MIIIDYKDKRPLYEQVVDRMQNLIIRGILEPDSRLPSVRSMAVDLSINPNTIQRAYAELEQAGFLYTVKGRGNYVSANADWIQQKQNSAFAIIKEITERAKEIGISKEEIIKKIDEYYGEEREL